MKPDEMKRYDTVWVASMLEEGWEVEGVGDGNYVLRSDAFAAIETARREERERALGWAKKFAAMSRAGYLHFRPLFEAIEEGQPLPTTPTGDENG